ncbi:MAG TPA: S49 family peptidase [Phycisphaerae bacterium]|nr:S49 family peptidase [Phycisphaerae bacterium]
MSNASPLLAAMSAERWAMNRAHLAQLRDRAAAYPEDAPLDKLLAVGATGRATGANYRVVEGVAIIDVVGTILKEVPWVYEMSGCDATGTLDVSDALDKALTDKNVDSIILYVDSPGGTVDGVQELADDVWAARMAKPIHAIVSDLCASAAYWIASQCSTIAANRSAYVGSIGCYMQIVETYRAWEAEGIHWRLIKSGTDKGAGADGTVVSDEQMVQYQEDVDGLADLFIAAVARGRGSTPERVAELATGRGWLAGQTARGGPTALELGLIDLVENSDASWRRVAETDTSFAIPEDQEEPDMGLFGRKKAQAEPVEPAEAAEELKDEVEEEEKPVSDEPSDSPADEPKPADVPEPEPDEEPAPAEDEDAEPEDPAEAAVRSKARLYLDALGAARAVQALADGTPIFEALVAVRAEQDARIEALEADLAKAKARLADLHVDGEPDPLSTKAGDEEGTINPKHEANLGPNLGRTASAMRLPGKKD